MSNEPTEAVPPPILTGRNLWLFRAWLYLPLPFFILTIVLYQWIKLPPSEAATIFRLVILFVLTSMTVVIYLFERKFGLHWPTKRDIQSLLIFVTILAIGRPISSLILDGHVSKVWFSTLLISIALTPIIFPFSIILNSARLKKEEAGSIIRETG